MTTRPQLAAVPAQPASVECRNAWRVLEYAHSAARAFLNIFDTARSARGRGAPTDEEQDLLRAMLVFASAGLDSMVKHLVREALPSVIRRATGPNREFRGFVERHMKMRAADDKPNYELLIDVLLSESPRDMMVSSLVSELTGHSLQSAEQLFMVGAHFNVSSQLICPSPDELKQVFNMRNQIVHEMDIDFSRRNRNRISRSRDDMVAAANQILEVADAFLAAVDAKCADG